jgi:UDP-GlcNAc:undecaprenyl-phosphate GlcNAc-1-phosphate transferase
MFKLVYASAFLAGAGISLALIPLVRRFAFMFHVLDHPSQRKIHTVPIPLLGGLAVYFAVLLSVVSGLLATRFAPSLVEGYTAGIVSKLTELMVFLATSALVVFVGLLDDLYHLKPFTKLFFQIVCGVFTFLAGIKISLFSSLPAVHLAFTVFWIVLCMNSFNLLDHMDGLSAGVALIAGGIFFFAAYLKGQLFIAVLLACFLGGIAGFLWYNFPPASIFLGDCGSSFLGYFLGSLAIMGTYYRYKPGQSFLPVFSPLIIFALPFFDTLGVILIRLGSGRSIFQADTNHLTHRLVRLGMSRKQAVLFCYLLTLACGLGALLLNKLTFLGGVVVLTQVILVLACVAILESSGRKNG